jgi:ABC-type Fe3+ transport system permease subunit
VLVLTPYDYELTMLIGVPPFHLTTVVAIILLAITFPLVWMKRRLLARARRHATATQEAR